MKRLLAPFDSLGPARGDLIAGYSVAYAFSLAIAAFCLFNPYAAGLAISPIAFCGLRSGPYRRLGVDPNERAGWKDPLLTRVFGLQCAAFFALVALTFYLFRFDAPHAGVFAIKPSHLGFALVATFVPPFFAVVHLRRLSWLAKHKSSPIDPMAVWQ